MKLFEGNQGNLYNNKWSNFEQKEGRCVMVILEKNKFIAEFELLF